MQSSSFLAHQHLLQSKKGRNNARSLFQVEELPSDQQIRNLIDPLAAEHCQTDVSKKISCLKCLKRADCTGTELFYHSAITPGFVKPGQAHVLPLPPEFITPQDGREKQDCERVAAKRWLAQHHKHFDDHSITYLGDDLYATNLFVSYLPKPSPCWHKQLVS